MKKLALFALPALSLLACGVTHAGTIDNFSFENGLSDYSHRGNVHQGTDGSYLGDLCKKGEEAVDDTRYCATDGHKFAVLQANDSFNRSKFVDTTIYGGTNGSYLDLSLNLNAGQSFGFDWAFLAGDINGGNKVTGTGNDSAWFSVNNSELFRLAGVNDDTSRSDDIAVGVFGDTGWNLFNFTATTAGEFHFRWVLSNHGDRHKDSRLLIDNLRLSSLPAKVPEPTTLALLGLGLAALGGLRRRA